MRWPRPRVVGQAMVVIGCVTVLVSVVAVLVGQALISQVEDSVDDSLALTSNALDVVVDSITVTSTIVETVQSGASSIATTLDTLTTSVDETSTAIASTTEFLAGPLPDALDAVEDVLPTIESIADSIDNALRLASRAPFGPDYNPAKPFDEAIAELSLAIGPLPAQLRGLAWDFSGLDSSGTAISDQLALLAEDVELLDEQLGEVSTLVERYAATAAEAQLLTAISRLDLESSAGSARLLLVLFGTVFALGQVVPIWLGTQLIRRSQVDEVFDTIDHDRDVSDAAASEPAHTL